MQDQSTPQDASHASAARERLAEAIEWELEKLREARPALESRLDRASGLLVTQVSCPPRSRPVRVRVHGEKAWFLVNSLASAGAVYSVDPANWRCSCPDFNRRNQACKHVLAAYVLKRVAQGARA
jgi:hypothetical protein